MKLTTNSNQLSDNPTVFMRKAGYAYIHDRHSGRDSYVRRLTGNFYPRLHCYVSEQGASHPSDKHGTSKGGASGQTTFNLHLDQRATRYEGQTAHAGEYDGQIVQEEIDRLQNIINKQPTQQNTSSSLNEDVENTIETESKPKLEDFNKQEKKPSKKWWWPF